MSIDGKALDAAEEAFAEYNGERATGHAIQKAIEAYETAKAKFAIESNPRNLTPHQIEVEEAAGMTLDWGLNAAYSQGRVDAIRDYADAPATEKETS